ncbi:MAG: hypothetical protein ACOCX4_06110 [Planctomycetota bacterium]
MPDDATPDRTDPANAILAGWNAVRDAAGYLRRHWVHLVLMAPGVVGYTALHEAAHALAVVGQGGTVTEFVIWPTPARWGHVRWTFPAGAEPSRFLISIAPYLLVVAFVLLAGVLAAVRRTWPQWAAGAIFLYLVVAPQADVANAALPWLLGRENDFRSAFGPPTALGAVLVGVTVLIGLGINWGLQRRLYGEHALGPGGYLLLAGGALLGVACIAI